MAVVSLLLAAAAAAALKKAAAALCHCCALLEAAALQMSVHLDSILSTMSHGSLAKLSFKSINKARLERAAAAVVAHANIVNVDLSHNSITSNDAAHIAHIITSAPHVERLNISCNDFSGAEGCRLISAALQDNTVSFLPSICSLSTHMLPAAFACACPPVPRPHPPPAQSLKHLDIRASRVTDEGALHLVNALARNSCLLSLNIGNCHVTDASVDAICRVITGNSTLKSLHLKGCDISQPALLRVLDTARESGRFDGMGANALDAPGAQSNMLQEVGCCIS